MAVTQHANGSQTATIDTEHFLGTDPDTTAGAFQFFIDLVNMARADQLEIRLYEKINDSGDTARLIKLWTVNNAQDKKMWASPVFLLMQGWRFSITQTDGTGRVFEWSIRKASATITQHANGTTSSLTLDSETFLGTDPDTTAGAYQFLVETNNMALGDILHIRVYEKIRDSSDTAQECGHFFKLMHAQDEPLWVSPSFLLLNGWRFSLEQTDGTGRTYQWSIRKAA